MGHSIARFWRPPDRLPRPRARSLAGLAAFMFPIAVTGGLVYDGWQRVVYVVMFLAIGSSNLAWALGSLLPEGRRARAARAATLPASTVMVLAMVAWVALSLAARR